MNFEDKSIQCSDCGVTFTFNVKEQEFFQTKGFTNNPRCCLPCRQLKKAQVENTWSIGNNGGYGANTYSSRQMFSATCSDCGKVTEVPLEPRTGKPVYCSDCFKKVRVN